MKAGISASTQNRLSSLSKSQAEALRALLESRTAQVEQIPAYPRIQGPTGARAPASWAQQRLWFVEQLEGSNPAYHLSLCLRLRGYLDRAALQIALNALVRRHEVLRTVFVHVEGVVEQRIANEQGFHLQFIDLPTQEGDNRADVRIESHRREEIETPFDLRTGPCVRGRLLRVAEDEHVLLITLHHIVCDGWSLGIITRELTELYRNSNSELYPAMSVQYADYAQWQRQPGRAELYGAQLRYWKERLERATAQIELPTDRPRAPLRRHGGGSVGVSFGAQLSGSVRAAAQRHGLTPFMMLCAGWAFLLARLSGQDAVSIGTPVSNRERPELEALVGPFVNTVVLRIGVPVELSLADFLQRVKEVTLDAYAHQDVPFEQVVDAVRPRRGSSHNALFQVMFVLQNRRQRETTLTGLTWSEEDILEEHCMSDLLLSLEDRGEEFSGYLNYATDLFERGTAEHWAECLIEVMKGMSALPAPHLGELVMLAAHRRHEIVSRFNATAVDYPRETLLHELFEEQVKRSPEATALVYEQHNLTYSELNRRANQLAWYIKKKGVHAEQRVAICLERSLEMVIGLLGILKAGAAYVPLDPAYPAERLAYMLGNCSARVLLTQESLGKKLPISTTEVVVLESEWSDISHGPDESPTKATTGCGPRQLAYVIYTSGSTGQPKGAMNEHRGIVNRLRWMQEQYALGPQERVLQKTPFSFDVSVWEFFWTLMSGATLVIARPEGHKDPDYLRAVIEESNVTTLHFVPSMLEIFLANQQPARCRTVRHVVCSGEELPSALARKCLDGFAKIQLSNLYGPTEAAVDVTAWECSRQYDGIRIPIGRPIANTEIHILDPRLKMVPIGVVGEIYIAGVGVGRGYLNQPALTAERFVADPFRGRSPRRMYKTGDLGRRRADGAIEYLGRNDHQVKIRGLRIELGEIEAQLRRQQNIRDAVVLAREHAAGEKRLVAYLVCNHHREVARLAETLRGSLKAVLPDHMIPSAFVELEQLPLTPNGKLDRQRLPQPDAESYARRQYEPARNEVEGLLVELWQALLRVEQVGRDDNFFELGGHSLLLVTMLERLRDVGLHAELRDVFESATLAELAGKLTKHALERDATAVTSIPFGSTRITPQMLTLVHLEQDHLDRIAASIPGGAANIQDIYPLTPLQEGILFNHQLNELRGDPYVVGTLLEVTSFEQLDRFSRALQRMVERHDILRTALRWEDLPGPVQVVHRCATLPLEQIALNPNREPLEQLQELMDPSRQKMDLGHAPLVRLRIVSAPQGSRCYVLFQMHHIVGDNTAQEIIISEIAAQLGGRPLSAGKAGAYRDHVAQTMAFARSHDSVAFFKDKFRGVLEPTAPFGLLDVHGDGSQVQTAQQRLDATLANRLRAQARRFNTSPATLFHVLWALVVAHTSGRDDVVYGTVLSGRLKGSAGAQRILGMFINTLPLRLRIGDGTIRELLVGTQRELVDLLDHEHAPLAIAQRCASIPGGGPLFSALLNYRHSNVNLDMELAKAGGMNLLATHGGTSYPLSLAVDDQTEGFELMVETDRRVDPRRIMDMTCTAARSVVEALETEPTTLAMSLDVLPERERCQVVESFNDTATPLPGGVLAHELFEEHARSSPEVVAVTYMRHSVTYGCLNARANQLARLLRSHGTGAGERVGVCLDRGIELVACLLAILKAGGAYVPLDPNHPKERLRYMLNDSAPRIVLTRSNFASKLSPARARVIEIDSLWARLAAWTANDLPPDGPSGDGQRLAYLIYTSGSTGEPKGVAAEHRSLVNRIRAQRDFDPLEADDICCQKTSIGFVDSIFETLGPLSYGRTLVVAPSESSRDVQQLAALIERQQVSRLITVPSLARSFLEDQSVARSLGTLHSWTLSGETLPEELLGKLREALPRTRFINIYGSSEVGADVTLQVYEPGNEGPAVIGKPLANLRVYILDFRMQPTPIGIAGEIYVGGLGLARGYWNRPDFTAERFVADPFANPGPARLFKTGDIGCWNADGAIEYAGRRDHQVKIRGMRVELGEIETQLSAHGDVAEAVVVTREAVPGEKELVAYVTPSSDHHLTVTELRSHLSLKVPAHMIPRAIVVLRTIPRTISGKVNRLALPEPDLRAYVLQDYEPPRGDIEETLAEIWQRLLQVEQIGRGANFFELGGHSLHGLRLISAVREQFAVSLPFSALFQSPTIQKMAAAIEQLQSAVATASASQMQRQQGVI